MTIKRKLELEYDGYTLVFVNRRGVISCQISKDGNEYHFSRAHSEIPVRWNNLAEAIYDAVRTLKGK